MIHGIGIDAVTISRMQLDSHALKRLFHADEFFQAMQLSEDGRNEFFAARFAAKEAFSKALGTGLGVLRPGEIKVIYDEKGKPSLHLEGHTLEMFHNLVPSGTISLSLTHEPPLAIAMVVIERS